MAKVIIAIHGLGNKPVEETLKKWALQSIHEGMEKLGEDFQLPQFELVYWADLIYDRPQSPDITDKNSPYFLDEIYTPEPKNFEVRSHLLRRRFLSVLKIILYKIFLNENYELRYSFVSEKLLHNYFHELEVYFTENCEIKANFQCETKKKIVGRLVGMLKKHANDEVLLVAHSMGSIIAFDVLSFIAAESKIDMFVTMGAPLGLPFVVSKIANHSMKNNGYIRLQTPESVNKKWYNLSDIEDKIALDYKLSDDFVANSKGVKVVDKLVTNTYAMNGIANPHKSFGYSRTKEFITIIKDFITTK